MKEQGLGTIQQVGDLAAIKPLQRLTCPIFRLSCPSHCEHTLTPDPPAQAQLAINHPNEALTSALTAYEMCVNSKGQTSSAATISQVVLKSKKAKWEARERERLRKQSALLGELEDSLERSKKADLADIDERASRGEMGAVAAEEERAAVVEAAKRKVEELRSTFALADPKNVGKREVPDYLVDNITFEIMHDRELKLPPLVLRFVTGW